MQRVQRIVNKAVVATRSGGLVMGQSIGECVAMVVQVAGQRFVSSAGQFQQELIHAV